MSRDPTEFSPSIRRSRLRKLLRLKEFLETPVVVPWVLLLLNRPRVRLTSATTLFTLRTCEVTWLGRKILKLPNFLLPDVNRTGPLAMDVMDNVVLLWVLLLSPDSIMLAKLMFLLKVPVASMVLRLTTVLTMNRTLPGRMVL